MSKNLVTAVKDICSTFGRDSTRMMDIVRAVQGKFGCVSDEAIDLIAQEVSTARVEVESMVSFYAFLSKKPKGKIVIRLCNDIIDRLNGCEVVAQAFSEELGIGFGETTPDGKISLEYTPCIGMCDQAPAALVNEVAVTELSSDKVRKIVQTLKETGAPQKLVSRLGDGNNADKLVKAMVRNNIRKKGSVVFGLADAQPNAGLEKALAMSPVEVINEIKTARLRGRGGAGFPAGMKWEFTRAAEGDKKFIICNADEGEPGTFKDRVILTELADRVFEGMTIAGYAIGAENGILYLRGEYAFLHPFLSNVLKLRRKKSLLGRDILGRSGFNFDIRIQMGAGAYVCGEESALISSCEGRRGDPKNRPPFPAQKGYLERPTCVNNVETLCCVVSILDKGAGWFAETGSKGSAGTKLLSVSGDCQSPGIYELPFGITVKDLLKEVGASQAKAVQIGGPSGQMICKDDFGKTICFDDLATGGAVMVFGPERNVLEIADYFMEFFIEESCGYCTPCRVGNVLLKQCLEKIMAGKGEPADLVLLQELGQTVKTASRCGLGQTSPNPVFTTLKNFRSAYEVLVKESKDGLQPSFDLEAVLEESQTIAGRKSVHL
jgi:[NiFe] hydrogenase diaphorase moiety large subunit